MRKILLILALGILVFGACGDKKMKIIENNSSKYKIIIPENSKNNETRAAEILQKYIDKMTGYKLEISTDKTPPTESEIVIGNTNRLIDKISEAEIKSLHPDGFIQKTIGRKLYIVGGQDKGNIYGVTNLLEENFGCKKYSPYAEEIPHKQDLDLPRLNRIENPATDFRCINGHFLRDSSYREWRHLDRISDMFADGYYVHTFERLVPWQKYFEKHPEYYAMVGGKRVKSQLCLSNPRVLDIVINKLREEMKKQPNKKYWSVSQNDNAIYCKCPECMEVIEEEGSPSGSIIRFVNKVAEEFPDKIISTLAYRFSRHAPKKTKPRDNVQIMLCTIECDRSEAIETNPDKECQSFVKDMRDWNKISDRIYLWDYTVNFHHHVSPFPNLHVLQPNIQFFVENDAYDMFQQTNTAIGHDMAELKSYMISKLLWDPYIDIEQVKSSFINGYFGNAAPWINKYLNHLEGVLKETNQNLGIYQHPVSLSKTVLSASNIESYKEYFNKAEASVKDESKYLNRVKIARLSLQYAIMEIGKNEMFSERGWYIKSGDDFTLRKDMKKRLEEFYQVCKDNNITSLDERGMNPESYYKSTKHFIDIKVEGNAAFRKEVSAKPLPSKKYSNGDLDKLTNGVQGASDYKVHWLGWEAEDFSVTVDLEKENAHNKIIINSLYDSKSWILHPKKVTCLISKNGSDFQKLNSISIKGEQREEERIISYKFHPKDKKFRYVKFEIRGTISLPDWHTSAGGDSWVFIDEIIVE